MAYYGSIDMILQQWADIGVFRYVLPFLIIFAVIYGILAKTKILGENKGVNATISLAAGLLALQFGIVPDFYSSIFPYLGVGLSVLLAALVLMGLVTDKDTDKTRWIWFAIGIVIFIIVVLASVNEFAWWRGFNGYGYDLASAVVVVLIIIAVGFVIMGDKIPRGNN